MTSRDSAIRRVAEKAFTQHGLEMWTVLETGECSLISEYVKMRLGVGRVHEACIRGKLDANICARDLKSPFGRLDVVLIYRKDRLLTAAQRRFVAAIAEKTGDAVRADSRISVERDR